MNKKKILFSINPDLLHALDLEVFTSKHLRQTFENIAKDVNEEERQRLLSMCKEISRSTTIEFAIYWHVKKSIENHIEKEGETQLSREILSSLKKFYDEIFKK